MRLDSQGQVLSQTSSAMEEAPSYSKLALNFVHGFCDFQGNKQGNQFYHGLVDSK